jgi:hypothetical protein
MKIFYFSKRIKHLIVQAILIVFVISALFSCSSLKEIGIQTAVMPEYPIDDDIQSMVLLNRSLTNQFSNLKVDSLEKILVSYKLSMDTVFQDSLASDTIIQVAAKALFESGRFDVVVPKERNVVRYESEDIANPLNTSFINEICKDFNVDAVLVLESFAERLNTKYVEQESVVYSGNEYNASTDLTYKAEWRLYRPNGLKPVARFQVIDSIYWKNGGVILQAVYIKMPRTKDALIGGGIAAGLKISEYISPKWVNRSRYYYLTGKNEIDAAVPLIKSNKWEEATEIWTKYATIESKTIKSRVEYNLALAAEMSGDIDLAIEWGIKSFKTKYAKPTEVYLKILDNKRKALQRENKKKF